MIGRRAAAKMIGWALRRHPDAWSIMADVEEQLEESTIGTVAGLAAGSTSTTPLRVLPGELVGEASRLCTVENGPRPAGPPDRCFYCGVPVGEEHRRAGEGGPASPFVVRYSEMTGVPVEMAPEDKACVLRRRLARLSVTLDIAVPVPEHWSVVDVHHRYVDGTWCADDLIVWLDEVMREGTCTLCPSTTVEVFE